MGGAAVWLSLPQASPAVLLTPPAVLFLAFGWLSLASEIYSWQQVVATEKRARSLEERAAALQQRLEAAEVDLGHVTEWFQRDYHRLFDQTLQELAERADLIPGDRVTLFRHDPADDPDGPGQFIRLGRFSSNPEYRRPGSGAVPDNLGVLAQAWQHGDCYVSRLPDPMKDMDEYVRHSESRCGMPPERVRGLRMKPRALYALALEDNDGQRVAVVVFESDKTTMNREKIKAVLVREMESVLRHLMAARQCALPSFTYAREEGY